MASRLDGPADGEALIRFRAAIDRAPDPEVAAIELLPVRLARACAHALAVDAAGLSLFSEDFRIPLGASAAAADVAERLQFSVGEGPCHEAVGIGGPVVAPEAVLVRRWPSLHAELTAHTPYRSVASVPFTVAADSPAAVDIYSVDPTAIEQLDVGVAVDIAAEIATALTLNSSPIGRTPDPQHPGPSWLHGPTPRNRMQVWVALGILSSRLDLTTPDALALLRANAYTRDETVDDIAVAIVNGAIQPDDIAP